MVTIEELKAQIRAMGIEKDDTVLIHTSLRAVGPVARLAFFNVIEGKRQKTETGCNKTYRGLPVTSISIIFPVLYLFRFAVSSVVFEILLHSMLAVVAFLFVLDFSVKKLDLQKIFTRNT